MDKEGIKIVFGSQTWLVLTKRTELLTMFFGSYLYSFGVAESKKPLKSHTPPQGYTANPFSGLFSLEVEVHDQ